MKFFTIFFTLIFIKTFLFSQDINSLYKQAQDYENEKKYKEAMLIYKEIVNLEQKRDKIFVDKDKKQELEDASLVLDTIEDKKTLETIEQMISSSFDLYPYEDNYFLPFSYISNKQKNRQNLEAKFQLSVKKPIAYNIFGLKENINFAYTQTSWWQIYAHSSPFRESNFKPEIFVTIPYGLKDKTSIKRLKFGLLHESNGQSEPESRSWNRLYAQSSFQISNLFITPRIWYKIPESEKDDDNPDIEDYLGYGDLNLLFPYKTHTFKLLLRNNLKFDEQNRGFFALDWSFPLLNSKNSFAFIQLSNGYGDSLIDYNKEISRISFGISLSR